ncbi:MULTISPECIES: HAD family hydrolase [Bacillaceae]|uniref:HAD family hydrolase n=1 Tax=Evansella alkalicola TaxID=745819 RepID=A0ABS6JW27_9BACI|nr:MULTISPECIES: HAD family hydrolase [Bacillaceae]MBU9722801.1 HAD family hydrolase [Bacillus alkalicola]
MMKAAIFDLDGTLLNRDASVKDFINRQHDRLSEQLRHVDKDRYISRFIELDQRGYVWKDSVYQQLVQEFEINEVTWQELLDDYKSEFKNHCIPFENLTSMLEKLKQHNFQLGMITNGYGQFQMDNIEALNIKKYFDAILISELEQIKKPNPQIFKRALERLEVSAEESIFVGDHPENDVKAAKNVGMIGVWKRDHQWNEEEVHADYIISDLGEVPLFIERA